MDSISLDGSSGKEGQLVPSQGPRTKAPTSAKKMVRRPVPYRRFFLPSHIHLPQPRVGLPWDGQAWTAWADGLACSRLSSHSASEEHRPDARECCYRKVNRTMFAEFTITVRNPRC